MIMFELNSLTDNPDKFPFPIDDVGSKNLFPDRSSDTLQIYNCNFMRTGTEKDFILNVRTRISPRNFDGLTPYQSLQRECLDAAVSNTKSALCLKTPPNTIFT